MQCSFLQESSCGTAAKLVKTTSHLEIQPTGCPETICHFIQHVGETTPNKQHLVKQGTYTTVKGKIPLTTVVMTVLIKLEALIY